MGRSVAATAAVGKQKATKVLWKRRKCGGGSLPLPFSASNWESRFFSFLLEEEEKKTNPVELMVLVTAAVLYPLGPKSTSVLPPDRAREKRRNIDATNHATGLRVEAERDEPPSPLPQP